MTDQRQVDETQPEQTEIEDGGAGLDGDAAGAVMGADLEDDTAGDAEMTALDEEDDDEADVTASGAE